jgi:hypothetical protein
MASTPSKPSAKKTPLAKKSASIGNKNAASKPGNPGKNKPVDHTKNSGKNARQTLTGSKSSSSTSQAPKAQAPKAQGPKATGPKSTAPKAPKAGSR